MSAQTKQDRFIALVEQHKGILFKAANAFCKDAEGRNDLMQEIIAQLWTSFDRFDARYRFSTWMYRVAMNVAISYYRNERRRIRDADSIEAMEIDIKVDEDDARDDIRQLHQLINQLDEINRALVILYLDGYGHDEIAEIMGLTNTNVATRLNRIKQRLQRDYDALQKDKGGERR